MITIKKINLILFNSQIRKYFFIENVFLKATNIIKYRQQVKYYKNYNNKILCLTIIQVIYIYRLIYDCISFILYINKC